MSYVNDLTLKDYLDGLIRSGQSKSASKLLRKRLGSLKDSPFERKMFCEFARLCRRAGIPHVGIRLLNPIVRPKVRSVVVATHEEKAEYAALLAVIGAHNESLDLLHALNPKENPEILLYEALARFTRWEYRESISPLQSYVDTPHITPYQRRVGSVNLASAFVYEGMFDEADALLARVLADAKTEGNTLIYANALGVFAEGRIARGDLTSAESALDEARLLTQKVESLDALYIRKWKAVLDLKKLNQSVSAFKELAAIKVEAISRGNWETARDCDFYLGVFKGDLSLLRKLFVGTPYVSYRLRIQKNVDLSFSSEYYKWQPPRVDCFRGGHETDLPAGGKPNLSLDETLKPGQVLHRLLHALTWDFYRSPTLPVLHSLVFPERFYNPVSSPQVIHQGVKRLRKWLKQRQFPVVVLEKQGSYRLFCTSPVNLKIPIRREAGFSPEDLLIKSFVAKLRGAFSNQVTFSRMEAAGICQSSKSAMNLNFKKAIEKGSIVRHGSGPKVVYSMNSKPII